MAMLRFLVRRVYPSGGGSYGFEVPALAGPARLVRGTGATPSDFLLPLPAAEDLRWSFIGEMGLLIGLVGNSGSEVW